MVKNIFSIGYHHNMFIIEIIVIIIIYVVLHQDVFQKIQSGSDGSKCCNYSQEKFKKLFHNKCQGS